MWDADSLDGKFVPLQYLMLLALIFESLVVVL